MNPLRRLTVGGAAVLVSLACALPVHATPTEGDVERTDLGKGTTDVPVSIVTNGMPSTLIVQGLQLGPGASSGWHTHPGTEYSVINTGTVLLQTAGDCVPHEFGQGQAVFIPAGVPHRVANTGSAAAEVVVTYTVPVDSALRDDASDACAK